MPLTNSLGSPFFAASSCLKVATHFNIMSQEFTIFVNFCIIANSGTGSFDNVTDWLLSNSGDKDLLLLEGPIDFLFSSSRLP